MVAYATIEDITKLYGQNVLAVLGDPDDLGTVDNAAVNEALQNASDLIDASVATVYELPLASTPSVLKPFCVDIALYRLALRYERMTDMLRERYGDAQDWLKRLESGKVTLNIPAAALPDESASGLGIGTVTPVRG